MTTSETTSELNSAEMQDRIETVLRAIANSPRRQDGESLQWTTRFGYSGLATASVVLLDQTGKPIDRAILTASFRTESGHPTHAEITRALYVQAMKTAKTYASAFGQALHSQ